MQRILTGDHSSHEEIQKQTWKELRGRSSKSGPLRPVTPPLERAPREQVLRELREDANTAPRPPPQFPPSLLGSRQGPDHHICPGPWGAKPADVNSQALQKDPGSWAALRFLTPLFPVPLQPGPGWSSLGPVLESSHCTQRCRSSLQITDVL